MVKFYNIVCTSLCLVQLLGQVCGYDFLQSNPSNPAFDPRIYQDALDPELCEKQLEYLRNNTLLRLQFLDAGARIPRGFLDGNTLDLGNYFQCLGLTHPFQDSEIQGKYCLVKGKLDINLIANLEKEINSNDERNILLNANILEEIEEKKKATFTVEGFSGLDIARSSSRISLNGVEFRVAVCVPKTCTSNRGFQGLVSGLDVDVGLQFEEEYCRLPNDKPWAPVDYVTIVLIAFIGSLTVLSTSYDLYSVKILEKDSKDLNIIYRSFSIYTNTRRLLNFSSNPGSLDCVDGIRALALAWVIVGHTFLLTQPFWSNTLDVFMYLSNWTSLWVTAAPISVDTFFMLSGLLVVYSTAGKLTGKQLLKNVHLFYLNRLIRMFPILAAGVLLEASIAHRVSDGPYWQQVADAADTCRSLWWATLLHVQNYVNPMSLCINQAWYLSIDVQLHILSPIVLVWLVGSKRRVAWITLAAAMLISLTSATIYSFVNDFPSALTSLGRLEESRNYMIYYYMNTLTRAPAFFVGMIFGYVLHIWRGKKLIIPKLYVTILWIFTFTLFTTTIYATFPATQLSWDNQIADSMINSFQRPAWALGLGWLILACVHGYGGPINWLLCLQLWKLPARISYGMYILHMSLISIVNGSRLAPIYFSNGTVLYNFLSQYAMAFIVAFIVTVLIDSPCSVLFKIILGQGFKAGPDSKAPSTNKVESKEENKANGCSETEYDDKMNVSNKI